MTSRLTPLHVVSHALPLEVGYTLRTHQIARAQRALGLDACVVSEPLNHLIRRGTVLKDGICRQIIDGVPYYRLDERNWSRRWRIYLTQYLRQNRVPGMSRLGWSFQPGTDGWDRLLSAVAGHAGEVSLVHAHTPFVTARYGQALARRLRVPFVYEVRGFWDATADSEGLERVKGHSISDWQMADTQMSKDADAVITLGEAMREELILRGVEADKIMVNPNCIDVDRFRPAAVKDPKLCEDLALGDSFVIGYVTSVRKMEGLDCLLAATKFLVQDGVPVKVVIVGSGNYLGHLQQLATELDVDRYVHFVGRVPHAEIQRYYSVFDVFVVPRADLQVCRLVTPLKPLEAMAFAIPVVVSDLPALREIIRAGDTGMVFRPGDAQDLARVLAELYRDSDLRSHLSKAARTWVAENRTWEVAARNTTDLYAELTAQRTSA